MAWDYEIKRPDPELLLQLHRIIRVKWWKTFQLNYKPPNDYKTTDSPNPITSQSDPTNEILILRQKAATLEKELTQLWKRVAAFEDSQDPDED
ncbi:hypothetical protein Dimus_023015, partial [Dionaea muscipula]